MIGKRSRDLWDIVWGRPFVDSTELAEAVQHQAQKTALAFRTRLLVRDSIEALRSHWGSDRVDSWLARSPVRGTIEAICLEDLGEPGFPTLMERVMDKSNPEDIRAYFRKLGTQVHQPIRLVVRGSIALILPELLVRATEEVDVVDEIPAEIRNMHKELKELRDRFGFRLAHFQSHYLPEGWAKRVHSVGSFGKIQLFLVDPYDVALSKLFSGRTKDRDDLRVLAPLIEKDLLVRRLQEITASLRAEKRFLQDAEKNWYLLFGESLPLAN
jgi:hypothetical protein